MNVGVAKSSLVLVKTAMVSPLVVVAGSLVVAVSSSRAAVVSIFETVIVASSLMISAVVVNPTVASIVALDDGDDPLRS